MPVRKTTAVTVGTSATRLDVQDDSSFVDQGQDATYYSAKTNAITVWLGDANVTAGNGIALEPGGVASEHIPVGSHTYAVVASGTCQVNVDQVGI